MNRTIIYIFLPLFMLFVSCTDEDTFELEPAKCEVSFDNLNYGSSTKANYISRGNAPENLTGLILKVEHLGYSSYSKKVYDIDKTYTFTSSSYYGMPQLDNVVEGRNKFTVTTYGGTPYNGVVMDIPELNLRDLENIGVTSGYSLYEVMSGIWGTNRNIRAELYRRYIQHEKPMYASYTGEATADITAGRKNKIYIDMKPQGCRMTLIFDYQKPQYSNFYYNIYIDGSKKMVLNYNKKCKAYIHNTDETFGQGFSIRIEVRQWQKDYWGRWKDVKIKDVYKDAYVDKNNKDAARLYMLE